MSKWTWAAARRRGTSHVSQSTRCQDAFKCGAATDGTFVVVLTDGAGSAPKGGVGAAIVARTVFQRAIAYADADLSTPDDETLRSWLDDARERVRAAAAKRGLRARDFASTLVCVMATLRETIVLHIGDGGAVGKTASGEWQSITWPAHGEYASTTFFVTDDPEPKVAIERHQTAYDAVVAFTDGLERLVLDFAQKKPYAKFFDGISAPIIASEVSGRDRRLSEHLGSYLDSDPVNARTDDDKTLVIAARR